MATEDPAIKQIAEIQGVEPANAEAYVKSLGRQLEQPIAPSWLRRSPFFRGRKPFKVKTSHAV